MKRFFLLLFVLMSLHSQAQVHIYSSGKTIVGGSNITTEPLFSIGAYGSGTNSTSYINNSQNKIGLCVRNVASAEGGWALRIYNFQNNNGSCIGAMIASYANTNQPSYGVKSYGGYSSHTAYGVYGGLQGTSSKAAGIYGSASSATVISNTGIYAGYFNGDVYTTGNIYGTVLTRSLPNNQRSIVSTSDSDSRECNITDRISNLTVVQAFVNEGVTATEYMNRGTVFSDSSAIVTSDLEKLDRQMDETQEDITVVNSKSTGLRYGLDCESLKKCSQNWCMRTVRETQASITSR